MLMNLALITCTSKELPGLLTFQLAYCFLSPSKKWISIKCTQLKNVYFKDKQMYFIEFKVRSLYLLH